MPRFKTKGARKLMRYKRKVRAAKVANAPVKAARHLSYLRGNENEMKYCARTSIEMYNGSGANASVAVCVLTEYAGWYRNSGGVYTALNMSADFTRLTGLYDLFTVDRVRATFSPYISAQTIAANDGVFPPIAAPLLTPPGASAWFYMVSDHDDDALLTSETQALNKSRGYNAYRGTEVKHTYTSTQDRRLKWFNTSANNPNAVPVATGTITDQIQNRSSIKVYFPNMYQWTNLGRLVLEFDMRFKSLRTI